MKEVTLRKQSAVIGYPTFWDAVRHNDSLSIQELAKQTSQFVRDKVVSQMCWDDDRIALLLDGDSGLLFIIESAFVAWHLINKTEFDQYCASWTLDSEPLQIKRQYSDGHWSTIVMDRVAMTTNVLQKRIRRIVFDEFGTYLHFQFDPRYLSFHAQVIDDSGKSLLEWFEDAD